MRSPAAQLLETALALQRAPGERFRLRERPLAAGVIHLIEIAAGSPPALAAAAAELGEPEPVLLEAARFYLEQVLFADPDADAYRVLGVAADVPHETIRIHHRWLQRWLHPDRAQAGDASVFATRVNQAFAQLRSPEARHAYDVRLAEARLAGASAPLPPETLRHWEHAEGLPPGHGRRSRWLLAAGLAACVVLAVLIVREQEPAAPWQPEEDPAAAAATVPPGSGPERGADDPAPFERLGEALATGPAAAPEPGPPSGARLRAAAEPAAPAPAPAPPPSRPRTVPAAAFAAATPPPPPATPAPPPTARIAATRTVSAAPAPATTAPARTQPAAPAQPAPGKPQAVAAAPAPARVVAAQAEPAPAAPAPARPADRDADAEAALVAQRLPLAQERIDQLAGYLAARPGVIPLWDTVQAMDQTDQARQRLDARKGSRLELGDGDWRVRADQVNLEAPYRCRANGGAPCTGRLQVSLVWREGLWLVRTVALEPSA